MKWLPIAGALLVVLMAMPTQAQTPAESASTLRFSGGITPGEVTATPEMWFYQQQVNRWDDPAEAVRRKAEYRSVQRDVRLASRRWFGVSLARPMTSTATQNGEHAATWTGGSPIHPYQWSGAAPVVVVERSERSRSTY